MIKMIISDIDADRDRAIDILQGDSYKYILQDFDNYLRNVAKHSDDEDYALACGAVRTKLLEMVEDSGITLWG